MLAAGPYHKANEGKGERKRGRCDTGFIIIFFSSSSAFSSYIDSRVYWPGVLFSELAWERVLTELGPGLVDSGEVETPLPLLVLGGTGCREDTAGGGRADDQVGESHDVPLFGSGVTGFTGNAGEEGKKGPRWKVLRVLPLLIYFHDPCRRYYSNDHDRTRTYVERGGRSSASVKNARI